VTGAPIQLGDVKRVALRIGEIYESDGIELATTRENPQVA